MIDVIIADDQQMVRSGLRSLLQEDPEITVVAEVADGAAAVEAVRALQPDVVLMDIRMPVLDGLSATRELARGGDAARILVLTTFDLDEYVFDALHAGASGFLLKDSTAEDLVNAVKVLSAGNAPAGPCRDRPRDRCVRHGPPAAGGLQRGRPSHRSGATSAGAASTGSVERRDCPPSAYHRCDHQDARQQHPQQAAATGSRPSSHLGLRARAHPTADARELTAAMMSAAIHRVCVRGSAGNSRSQKATSSVHALGERRLLPDRCHGGGSRIRLFDPQRVSDGDPGKPERYGEPGGVRLFVETHHRPRTKQEGHRCPTRQDT